MNKRSRDRKKLLPPLPVQIIIMGLFVAINAAWFIPALNSLRLSVVNIEKIKAEHGAMLISNFISSRHDAIDIPSRYISLPLRSKENESVIRKILHSDYFSAVSLVDASGTEIMKIDKTKYVSAHDLGSVVETSNFIEAVKTKEHAWSDIEISDTFEPYVILSVPVLSRSGEVIAVISGQFNFESLFLNSENAGEHMGHNMYVVNKKGLIISHPDVALVLNNVNVFDRKIVQDVFIKKSAVVSTDDTYTYKNEKGIEVLSAGAYVPDIDLAVIYEEPKSDALLNMWEIKMLFLSMIFAAIGIVLISRYLLKKADAARSQLEQTLSDEQGLLYDVEVSKEQLERLNAKLSEHDAKMREQLEELRAFQDMTVDRELKMIELKEELEKCGQHTKTVEKL